MTAVSAAREISFRILAKVDAGGYASDLLRGETVALESRDAALAETLVLGCLRYQSQLDFLIAHFAGRPQPKLDLEVRIALRLGIFQLRYLDRVPAHAAVAESVELVKGARKRSAAGFVNAVLRKVNRAPVGWPDRATELSIPAWMLERWELHYGPAVARGIAEAALAEPVAYVNPATGRRQDIGAQSIVPLLEIKPGMTVLDLCAAPGNKTAQAIAAGARVTACDRYLRRLAEVPAEAARLVLDAAEPLPFSTRGETARFDRILIDAPCSGSGTLAGNPEIKWRLQPSDLFRFQARQRKMIERALPHLRPGGLLVYATCSLEMEENEAVVEGFPVLATHSRIPGRDSGDGFFAAAMREGR
ncbi:MAG TPA: transcription antitermination factor NusB [Bryobacteraceae bacterium]|nr:transcription antitermination factor NusB [Bryobacteraceae bacterium]